MPSTDSFASSAPGVSSASATLTNRVDGCHVFTPIEYAHRFEVVCNSKGVYLSRDLGSGQAALTFPIARTDALLLAEAMLQAST
jgi:hypothetical protein